MTDSILQEIASDTGLLPSQVLAIAKTAPLRYKVFSVPKRTGGMRTLAQPAREVKALQYSLLGKIQDGLPIHDAVTAYQVGCSIAKNARRHAGAAFLLKMDFENFFPSIFEHDFVRHVKKYHGREFSDDDLETMSRILFWAPDRKRPLQLCIGAPTSPFISNTLLHDFDCIISSEMTKIGVTYTRYADDLAFSTRQPNVLAGVANLVGEVVDKLEYPTLRLNVKKTVHASRATRRVVTGIVITPKGELSVGRDKKRLIRSMWHRASLGLLSVDEVDKLNGLVNFVESIEPGYANRLRRVGTRNRDGGS